MWSSSSHEFTYWLKPKYNLHLLLTKQGSRKLYVSVTTLNAQRAYFVRWRVKIRTFKIINVVSQFKMNSVWNSVCVFQSVWSAPANLNFWVLEVETFLTKVFTCYLTMTPRKLTCSVKCSNFLFQYRILIYASKQQQVTTGKIHGNFSFTVIVTDINVNSFS